ncbi:MAG: FprA family A-type flavoprotein [Sphaerochaetaceae bacterium]|nr:FprA family A-type flavoprotein [Sphaerochaetaceae bacterium]
MQITRQIASNVFWVGGNDNRIERFENMFPLPHGVAYNAYIILDEKTVLLDTVDQAIREQFLENVAHVLNGRPLDYLVINHMEPDHCGNIEAIVKMYPQVTIIGNKKTFEFFNQYYTLDISKQTLVVKEGDTLSLGQHTLKFHMAPMVHWPEVMFTLEVTKGILFSADVFGSFGIHPGTLFADEVDYDRVFLDETRRYYANIVGRYGTQVKNALSRLPLDTVKLLCPLHGPIWRKDIDYIVQKHLLWSSYEAEKQGVVLVYASMYGNTENAVFALANKLAERGVTDMRIYDVSRTDGSYIIADLWKYSHFVLASPTYNMHVYLPIEALLRELAVLNFQKRSATLMGNHTWSSAAIKLMTGLLGTMKDIRLIGEPLDIRSSLKAEQEGMLDELADAISHSLRV